MVAQALRLAVGVDGIELVEHQQLRHLGGADVVQHPHHLGDLLRVAGVGRVDHMQQQVGVGGFLQGGGKSIDQASITSQGKTYTLSQGQSGFLSPITTFSLGQMPASRYYVLGAEGSLSSFRLAGLNVSAVPEPSSLAMMAVGLLGIGWLRRHRVG